MARLEFGGARYVRNYHLSVPHHELVLDKKKSLTSNPGLDDNLILHGDNLKALKALLPHFAGKVKCIYIDPPYNTGNEKWVYNDNVNSPRHKEWLDKVVDKDCQDRHDRWLSMMMPRLKILREPLRDDGVIFISIDDIEHGNLRLLMDEIFGERSFIGNLTVISTTQPDNIGRARYGLQNNTEYVLAYSKCSVDDLPPFVLRKSGVEKQYPHKGKFGKCRFEIIERAAEGAYARPTLQAFKIVGQLPREGKQWQIGEVTARELEKAGKLEIVDGMVKLAVYPEDDEAADAGLVPFWSFLKNAGTSQQGKAELAEVLPNHGFETVKHTSLLKDLIIHFPKDSLIVDSFAGSGTTAHAALALNKEDKGNRKFILVEQEDYADTITAERVRRVIKGVKSAKDENLKNGLGGSFSYYTLGAEYDIAKLLAGKNLPSYEEMASYCFFTATGENFDSKKIRKKEHFIGASREYDVYLFYEPDIAKLKSAECALRLDWVEGFSEKPERKRLVFAPVKYAGQDYLDTYGFEYSQLPYEIYRRMEEKTA